MLNNARQWPLSRPGFPEKVGKSVQKKNRHTSGVIFQKKLENRSEKNPSHFWGSFFWKSWKIGPKKNPSHFWGSFSEKVGKSVRKKIRHTSGGHFSENVGKSVRKKIHHTSGGSLFGKSWKIGPKSLQLNLRTSFLSVLGLYEVRSWTSEPRSGSRFMSAMVVGGKDSEETYACAIMTWHFRPNHNYTPRTSSKNK